jgi:hypothetical protein
MIYLWSSLDSVRQKSDHFGFLLNHSSLLYLLFVLHCRLCPKFEFFMRFLRNFAIF